MDRRKFVKSTALLTAGSVLGCTAATRGDDSTARQSTEKGKQAMKHKVKITVLKREYNQGLADLYLADPKVGPCQVFKEGQEFIVDNKNFFSMLDGKFCSEAWDAVSRYIYAALQGGSIMRGWTNDEKMTITCCNDGVRPVIFKLERIDET